MHLNRVPALCIVHTDKSKLFVKTASPKAKITQHWCDVMPEDVLGFPEFDIFLIEILMEIWVVFAGLAQIQKVIA